MDSLKKISTILAKLSIFLALTTSLKAFSDAVDTDTIFSDAYLGFLPTATQEANQFWSESYPKLSNALISPEANGVTTEIEVTTHCLRGGGGDCETGVLFKKKSTDAAGNQFYLVKNTDNKEFWIQANGLKPFLFDDLVGEQGADFVEAPNFTTTDRAHEDGVPDLSSNLNDLFQKVVEPIAPDFGRVKLTLPDDTKPLSVLDANKPLTDTFVPYPLQVLIDAKLAYKDTRTKTVTIELPVFKVSGSLALVTIPMYGERSVFTSGCEEPDLAYVWLETNETSAIFEKDPYGTPYAYNPQNRLIGWTSEKVVQLKKFNGNTYALIAKEVEVRNPVLTDGSGMFSTTHLFPYKWVKVRDSKGRMRFWFQNYSC